MVFVEEPPAPCNAELRAKKGSCAARREGELNKFPWGKRPDRLEAVEAECIGRFPIPRDLPGISLMICKSSSFFSFLSSPPPKKTWMNGMIVFGRKCWKLVNHGKFPVLRTFQSLEAFPTPWNLNQVWIFKIWVIVIIFILVFDIGGFFHWTRFRSIVLWVGIKIVVKTSGLNLT